MADETYQRPVVCNLEYWTEGELVSTIFSRWAKPLAGVVPIYRRVLKILVAGIVAADSRDVRIVAIKARQRIGENQVHLCHAMEWVLHIRAQVYLQAVVARITDGKEHFAKPNSWVGAREGIWECRIS